MSNNIDCLVNYIQSIVPLPEMGQAQTMQDYLNVNGLPGIKVVAQGNDTYLFMWDEKTIAKTLALGTTGADVLAAQDFQNAFITGAVNYSLLLEDGFHDALVSYIESQGGICVDSVIVCRVTLDQALIDQLLVLPGVVKIRQV